MGDALHNVLDGVLIAAAFLTDTHLGIVTAVAIMAHEIPQEVGNFAVLLHSGVSRRRALALNLLTSLTAVIGGVVGFFALKTALAALPFALAVAAASLLYVAVADLIPGLHRRVDPRSSVMQVLLIGAVLPSLRSPRTRLTKKLVRGRRTMQNPYAHSAGAAPSHVRSTNAAPTTSSRSARTPTTTCRSSRSTTKALRSAGWNWPAFFVTTPWFLYRKMWGWGMGNVGVFLGHPHVHCSDRFGHRRGRGRQGATKRRPWAR